MPILKNAKKALRQSDKRAERNQVVKDEISSNRRFFRKAIEAADTKKAEELYHKLCKMYDKAVKNNVFHANNAARTKSRMAAKIKALKTK